MHKGHWDYSLLRTHQPDSHCMLKHQDRPRICRTRNQYGKWRNTKHRLQESTCLRRNTDMDQYTDTSRFVKRCSTS